MAAGKYKEWQTKEALTVLSTWAKLGITDKDIADNMGINVKTLYDWKNKYCNISNALKIAKNYADAIIENALYKRACGYTYNEIKKETIQDAEGKILQVNKVTTITKEVAPDVTAQIYWLKNRQPDRWRDSNTNFRVHVVEDDPITISIKKGLTK